MAGIEDLPNELLVEVFASKDPPTLRGYEECEEFLKSWMISKTIFYAAQYAFWKHHTVNLWMYEGRLIAYKPESMQVMPILPEEKPQKHPAPGIGPAIWVCGDDNRFDTRARSVEITIDDSIIFDDTTLSHLDALEKTLARYRRLRKVSVVYESPFEPRARPAEARAILHYTWDEIGTLVTDRITKVALQLQRNIQYKIVWQTKGSGEIKDARKERRNLFPRPRHGYTFRG